jgi:hypothetical protein
MPQTTSERAARWPGKDAQAISFLEGRGWTLTRDWNWRMPKGVTKPTGREVDAVQYLIEEWDFGRIVRR